MKTIPKKKSSSTNFVKKKKKNPKRISCLKKWLIYGGGIIVVIAVVFGLHYSTAKAVYENAISGKEDFLKAQGAIGAQDFAGAGKALGTAEEKLLTAKEEFQKLRKFRFIPGMGRQISAIDNILIAGIELSSGLQELTKLGETIFSPIKQNGSVSLAEISAEETRMILQKLYESPPLLQGAKAEIDLAVQAIEAIPKTGLLGPLKKAVDPLKEQLPTIKKSP